MIVKEVSNCTMSVALKISDWYRIDPYSIDFCSIGKILGALLAGLSDKSTAVRKLYGNAIGHIVKVRALDNFCQLYNKRM